MAVVVDVVVWGCFVALGHGWRAIIDGTGNSAPRKSWPAISVFPEAQAHLGHTAE